MAIVIKGEMPKGKCWWHDEQGKEHECQFFPCTRDADNCPIIGEIPDKHGRLIDADALIGSAYEIQRQTHVSFPEALAQAFIEANILEASE